MYRTQQSGLLLSVTLFINRLINEATEYTVFGQKKSVKSLYEFVTVFTEKNQIYLTAFISKTYSVLKAR